MDENDTLQPNMGENWGICLEKKENHEES